MSEPVALLQIDIVDSTAAVDLFGDESMSTIWAEHDQMARRLLLEFGSQKESIAPTASFSALLRSKMPLVAPLHTTGHCAGMKAALKARARHTRRKSPNEAKSAGSDRSGRKALRGRRPRKGHCCLVPHPLGTGGQTLLTAEARQSLTANGFVIHNVVGHNGSFQGRGSPLSCSKRPTLTRLSFIPRRYGQGIPGHSPRCGLGSETKRFATHPSGEQDSFIGRLANGCMRLGPG